VIPIDARTGRDVWFHSKRPARPVLQHPLWSDVGPMIHFPAASTVLQRRRGYREVFQHFARLRLAARVPLAEKLVWNLLEAKDIAELYEVWCFFRVVPELKGLLAQWHKAPIKRALQSVGARREALLLSTLTSGHYAVRAKRPKCGPSLAGCEVSSG
jgi:hypothetical protein